QSWRQNSATAAPSSPRGVGGAPRASVPRQKRNSAATGRARARLRRRSPLPGPTREPLLADRPPTRPNAPPNAQPLRLAPQPPPAARAARAGPLRTPARAFLFSDIPVQSLPNLAAYSGPEGFGAPAVVDPLLAAPAWRWSVLRLFPPTWGPQLLCGIWAVAAF